MSSRRSKEVTSRAPRATAVTSAYASPTDLKVWATALRLAQGDATRLRRSEDGSVTVLNRAPA